MKTNIDLARECGMNAILGGGWWFSDDDQLDAFAERIRAAEQERCALLAESLQHAELCTPVNVADAIRNGHAVAG